MPVNFYYLFCSGSRANTLKWGGIWQIYFPLPSGSFLYILLQAKTISEWKIINPLRWKDRKLKNKAKTFMFLERVWRVPVFSFFCNLWPSTHSLWLQLTLVMMQQSDLLQRLGKSCSCNTVGIFRKTADEMQWLHILHSTILPTVL